MKKAKQWVKRLFCFPPILTVLIAVFCFSFVFYVLLTERKDALAYAAYLLSAWALAVTVTGTVRFVSRLREKRKDRLLLEKLRGLPVGGRLMDDPYFRTELSLYGGLLINLLYAAIKLVSGIYSRSWWLISLAAYYIILSAIRFVLVRYVRRETVGENLPAELRRCRLCGGLLLVMNQALTGIVILMVFQNHGYHYPGTLIYAMAVYTFYITITSVRNAVKFRKNGSPVISAAKNVNLTAALVSMLSLETAMLAQFGDGREDAFRRIMIGSSGGVICVIVLGLAVDMILRSTLQLKKSQTVPAKK